MNPHQLQLSCNYQCIFPVYTLFYIQHLRFTHQEPFRSGLVRKSQGTRTRLVEQRMLKDGERERERQRDVHACIIDMRT